MLCAGADCGAPPLATVAEAIAGEPTGLDAPAGAAKLATPIAGDPPPEPKDPNCIEPCPAGVGL